MAQFDVYANSNPASAKSMPFLLDVQADLLNGLATRVVVPLAKLNAIGNKPAEYLNPVFEVEGRRYVMLTPQMAGIPLKALGKKAGSLADRRSDIIRALDVVFSGI